MELSINMNVSIGTTPTLTKLLTVALATIRERSGLSDYKTAQLAAPEPKARENAPQAATEAPAATPAAHEPTPQQALDAITGTNKAAAELVNGLDLQPVGTHAGEPITNEALRAAIAQVRIRIEGEDYMTNKSSERVKKYHRAIGDMCKVIAAELGADIPTKLPDEKRAAFLKELEAIAVGEDGKLHWKEAEF